MTDVIGHIYGGFDADTREMRYVGKSKREFGYRPECHRIAARKGHCHRDCWIRKRLAEGRAIEWVVIEWRTDDDPRTLDELECGWIAFFRSMGCRLTNMTDGGDGGRPTPEVRAKISATKTGRKLSAVHRAKISETVPRGRRKPSRDVKRAAVNAKAEARAQARRQKRDARLKEVVELENS